MRTKTATEILLDGYGARLMPFRIGLTAGDPAGIGLEVILKSLSEFPKNADFVLFVDPRVLEANERLLSLHVDRRKVVLPEPTGPAAARVAPDAPGSEHGKRALAYLSTAAAWALAGRLDAIVTGPVSKEAVGGSFHGQTDFLAEMAGISRFAMAFFTPTFKVVLATVHMPLREALDRLTADRYQQLIPFVDLQFKRLGFTAPRIAVAAVNPHAGEGGMFGTEDDVILRPVVERCAAQGIRVSGPHPADSLYYRAHTGEFDVVIAPYHDQALIPVKLIAHGTSTNVTLGLPFVRTSPDHGTAFDIAGRGIADPSGMKSAIACAAELLKRLS